MNKEVIKKYKKEFDWWLNGGKLFVADSTEAQLNWLPLEPTWSCPDIIYIIDDKYLPFRKALAEGKIIQFLRTHIGSSKCEPEEWLDWNSYGECFDKNVKYRIKPEEPQLKVGDWVTNKFFNGNDTPFILKCSHKCYSKTWVLYLHKWEPKPNEWCWFYNTKKYSPVLEQFGSMCCNKQSNYTTKQDGIYEHCEPFIGTLPSTTKYYQVL